MAMSCIYHGECDGCMYCYDARPHDKAGLADVTDVYMESEHWPLLWQHSGAASEAAFPTGQSMTMNASAWPGKRQSVL